MNLDKRKLKQINDYFRINPVLKAYLFGSHSRDESESQSDIDILVDLDYSQKIGLIFFQMKIDLENILNAKVDLISSNGVSNYIKPFIDKDKQLIYAK